MGDAPILIFLLCDADECAFNESLKESRNKSTIKELEMEYENWINIEISEKRLQNELIGCQNDIVAYVDKDHMWFL